MALSDEERRLLAQLEASLAEEDPKLAHALRGTGTRKIHRRRAALAGGGFVLGMVLLIAGMQLSPVVSVAGFVCMLASAVIAISSWQHVNDIDPVEQQTAKAGQHAKQASSQDSVQQFMEKMEERWRKRQDEGM